MVGTIKMPDNQFWKFKFTKYFDDLCRLCFDRIVNLCIHQVEFTSWLFFPSFEKLPGHSYVYLIKKDSINKCMTVKKHIQQPFVNKATNNFLPSFSINHLMLSITLYQYCSQSLQVQHIKCKIQNKAICS